MKNRAEGDQFLKRYARGEFWPDRDPIVDSPLPEISEEDDHLLAIEDDLFDDYLSGELTEEGRAEFNDLFLDADGIQKLEFAATLRKYLAAARQTEKGGIGESVNQRSDRLFSDSPIHHFNDVPFIRRSSRPFIISICAATAVVTFVFAYALCGCKNTPGETASKTTSQMSENGRNSFYGYDARATKSVESSTETIAKQPDRQQLSKRSPVVGSSYPRNVMVCFFPASMIDTVGTAKKISIPAMTDQLHLQLGFSGDVNKAYAVHLKNRGGKSVYWQHGLMLEPLVSGTGITFSVPANILSPGNYKLALEETNPDGSPEQLGVYRMEVAPSDARF